MACLGTLRYRGTFWRVLATAASEGCEKRSTVSTRTREFGQLAWFYLPAIQESVPFIF